MPTKDINVHGNVFPCPTDWTVEEAEARIRSSYGIQFGGIEHNGISVLGTSLISSFTGNLDFVGGQSIQPLQQPQGK